MISHVISGVGISSDCLFDFQQSVKVSATVRTSYEMSGENFSDLYRLAEELGKLVH